MTVRCTGFMNAMLTCEELFLLLTKDSGKPESRMTYPAYGLTGALLTDLLLTGRSPVGRAGGGLPREEEPGRSRISHPGWITFR